ncbi:MAG: hydantoinase B/oxoprolinase family protein [Nitrospinota bacterium]
MSAETGFDPITLEVLWSRLISIVDEAGISIVRTSFSTTVRESHDFGCVLLDREGNSLAQLTSSIPSFIGTLPRTMKHFLRQFPAESWRPGDLVFTNDPWIGTGHLPDITSAYPVFCRGRLVAFMGVISHVVDIGGKLRAPDVRELFEEGLRLMPCKYISGGRVNEEIRTIIRHNVRVPDQVEGDILAQVGAAELGARRIVELMEEHGLEDLRGLAKAIHLRSEDAMRAAIAEVPDGDYDCRLTMDGFEEDLTLQVRVSVRGSDILVDYTGTSPQVDRALNVVPNYAYAYTVFPIKCALEPTLPNNEGCFRPIRVSAPEGCLLNPRFPAAVNARAMVGHYCVPAVFGALAQAIPEKVQAASGSPIWAVTTTGVDKYGERFANNWFLNGGQGATAHSDGGSCLSFPSNVSNTSIEVIENTAPQLFECKEIIPDSGGAGRFRGGNSQRVALRCTADEPVTLTFLADRTRSPAFGLVGGRAGRRGSITLNGEEINPKKTYLLREGDRLVLEVPGGGGFGEPRERDPSLILADLEEGMVTPETAREVYGYRL